MFQKKLAYHREITTHCCMELRSLAERSWTSADTLDSPTTTEARPRTCTQMYMLMYIQVFLQSQLFSIFFGIMDHAHGKKIWYWRMLQLQRACYIPQKNLWQQSIIIINTVDHLHVSNCWGNKLPPEKNIPPKFFCLHDFSPTVLKFSDLHMFTDIQAKSGSLCVCLHLQWHCVVGCGSQRGKVGKIFVGWGEIMNDWNSRTFSSTRSLRRSRKKL